MKEEAFYFVCGERAVSTYHSMSGTIQELSDDALAIMADYGYLTSFEVLENNTTKEVIDMVIDAHAGSFDITLISEEEYNFLNNYMQ